MKKALAVLIILVACISGVWAVDSSTAFGVSFGYGIQSEFVSGEGANTQSLVIGITAAEQFNKNSALALIVDGQFEIPLKTGNTKRSDIPNLKTWMNLGMIVGPAYTYVKHGIITSYVGLGLAVKEQLMKIAYPSYDYSALILSFGPGIVVHGTYKVSESFFVSGTMSQQYLFLNYGIYNGGKLKKIDDSFNLSTTARLGFGFSFN